MSPVAGCGEHILRLYLTFEQSVCALGDAFQTLIHIIPHFLVINWHLSQFPIYIRYLSPAYS
jgi:hypothetical protein